MRYEFTFTSSGTQFLLALDSDLSEAEVWQSVGRSVETSTPIEGKVTLSTHWHVHRPVVVEKA